MSYFHIALSIYDIQLGLIKKPNGANILVGMISITQASATQRS